MSAERLREAARLIRERAMWVRQGPWRVVRRDHGGPVVGSNDGPVLMGYSSGAREVEYVASMHPAVALAVADWLDHAAEACGLNRSPYVEDQHRLAHAVADAYLGVTP